MLQMVYTVRKKHQPNKKPNHPHRHTTPILHENEPYLYEDLVHGPFRMSRNLQLNLKF